MGLSPKVVFGDSPDMAKTPGQRLLKSRQINSGQKQKLIETYLSLNPVKLKNIIDQKIKKIRAMQNYKINAPTDGTKVTFLDV